MNSKKSNCQSCQSSFYGKKYMTCETCVKYFCPNCGGCECTQISQISKENKVQTITLDSLSDYSENELIEISGTLSPLIGQEPILTTKGKIIKTEFEFTDETGKVPITIWGPVPESIFPFRYEFIRNITFHGVKKRLFNGKPVITVLKSTKVYLNSFKTKNLDTFLTEA